MRSIELASPLTPEECALRLLAAIDPDGAVPIPGSRALVGRVSGHRIRVRKRLPGDTENSFQTVLLGRLQRSGTGTLLRSRVGMHPGAVGCMVVWVAAAGLGSAALAATASFPLLFGVLGVQMLAGGLGMVWLGRHKAQGEDHFLVASVADVIAATVCTKTERGAAANTDGQSADRDR